MTHRNIELFGPRQFGFCPEPAKQHASRALLWLLILCGVAFSTPAKADDLIGNLAGGYNGVNSFSNTLGFANSFSMGGDSYMLSDIEIVLSGMPALSAPIFQLRSDDGAPDGALLTLINPIFLGGGIQVYTFGTGTPFTLQANTTYWLTGTSKSTVLTHWEDSIGDQIPTGAGATYGGRDESIDGGAIWGGAPGNTDLFEVDGTLVLTSAPEPGSGGLAAIGFSLCFLAICWRRLAGQRPRRPIPLSFWRPLNGVPKECCPTEGAF